MRGSAGTSNLGGAGGIHLDCPGEASRLPGEPSWYAARSIFGGIQVELQIAGLIVARGHVDAIHGIVVNCAIRERDIRGALRMGDGSRELRSAREQAFDRDVGKIGHLEQPLNR